MSGMEKFKIVELDFRGVTVIGQAFADEVFRVFKNNHPRITIVPRNANEDVVFMIRRALLHSNGSSKL